MKKVLLIQGMIPHYRVPVFNELAKRVDLTVLYSEGDLPEGVDFQTLCIPVKQMRYKIHKKRLYFIAQKYDVVICMLDYSYLDFRLLNILPHDYKLIFWGIGVAASYNCRYDSLERVANKTKKIINKADAAVFYSDYPVEKYSKMGIRREKLFVANNTVQVNTIDEVTERDKILFIGSLYKQKKIDVLIENYIGAYRENNNIPELIVIGDGAEKDSIEDIIKKNNLEHKITLTGAVVNEDEISKYFERAIICISPDQAGLSVLKSMGYGVPYVTHKNAITGGEIFNIKNRENGILLNDFDELKDIILNCIDNKQEYIKMGNNARDHYYQNRTVCHMVDGFTDAVEYVLNKDKHGRR